MKLIAETKGKSRIYVSSKSYAAKKVSLELARKFFNSSRYAQRINTSFCLVITNQQSPDSVDSVARKL